MSSRSKTNRLIATLLLPAALMACNEDSTGPDFETRGTVTAEVHDDNSSSALVGSYAQPSLASAAYSGMARGEAQVEIWSEAEGWVQLGAPSEANFALQSSNGATIHSNSEVDAGNYTRVRLVMEGYSADLAAGATVGGSVLDASISIDIGGSDGRVVIEKSITPFSVQAESNTTITFDLNSEAWVDQESAESRTATDAEVESATRATVEQM